MRINHEDSPGFRSDLRSLSGCGGARAAGFGAAGDAGRAYGEPVPGRPACAGCAGSAGGPDGTDRADHTGHPGNTGCAGYTRSAERPDGEDRAGFPGSAGRPGCPGLPGIAKRAVAALVVLFVCAAFAGAQDLSVSLASWRFFPNRNAYRPSGEGLHASVGIVAGIDPRLEAALSVVGRLTPTPADNLFLAAGLGYSIAADRYVDRSTPTLHLNAIAEAGVMAGVHSLTGGGTPSFSTHLYARFTPIVIGSLYYGRRDRLYTVGLQYDIAAAQVSVILSVIGADIRLGAKR